MKIRTGLLLIGFLVAYQTVWGAGWVYEDVRVVADGGMSTRPVQSWTWPLTSSPQAAHGLNLALHVIVSALAGCLAFRLGLSRQASWFVGALILLQPVAVESVAYAASRGELMAALGILSACLLALWTSPWRWPLVALSVFFAAGSKETGVVAVLLVPLTCWAAQMRVKQEIVVYGILGCFLTSITAIHALDPHQAGLTRFLNAGETAQMAIGTHDWLLLQASAVYRLLGVSLSGLGMTVDYDYDALSQTARWIAAGACLGLLTLTIALIRTQRLIAFGLGWTALALLPRVFVQTPRSYLNEHQFYVPLIGLIVAGMAWWDSATREVTA